MDLEEKSSDFKAEELGEKDVDETIRKIPPLDEIKAEADDELRCEKPSVMNSAAETGHPSVIGVISSPGPLKVNGDLVEGDFSAESPSSPIGSPSSVSGQRTGAPTGTKKGYGLKKWRRIRRNFKKDGTGGGDSAQILKRRLSLAESFKSRDEHKHRSDGEGEIEASVASVESNTLAPSVAVVAPIALDPELGLLAATGFAIGIDSENSEERSSKSSTAASAPRLRHETIGFGRDRSKARGSGGRGSGHIFHQRGQQARGGIDAGKKIRGQHKVEKETSYSSVESDLRSSNTDFAQWGSVTNNGKKSDKSINYDGEHSDDAQPSEEVRSGYYKENGAVEDLYRADFDADLLKENINISENSRPGLDLDPFLESIASLQAAQGALENEIQKLGEIGKEAIFYDSDGQYEETKWSSSPTVETPTVELNKKVEHLQYKLEEALMTIKDKESRALELETILKTVVLPNKEIESTNLRFLQDKCKELEMEFEKMLEKKIEAEIEYLIMTRTTQNWKVIAEDCIALLEEQKILAGDQGNIKHKLKEAEDTAMMQKMRAEELDDHCKQLLQTHEVLKLQNKVCKYSLCCLVQIILLCIAFVLFLIHVCPSSFEVVPT